MEKFKDIKTEKSKYSFGSAIINLIITITGCFILFVGTFGLFNIVVFITSFSLTDNHNLFTRIIVPVVFGVIGLAYIGAAIYLIYKFLTVYAVNLFFGQVALVVRRICNKIVDKMSESENANFEDIVFDKSYNYGKIVNSRYEKNVPSFLRKGLYYILDFVPFGSIVNDMQEVCQKKDVDEAKVELYERVEKYITASAFRNDSFKMQLLLFVLNIVTSGLAFFLFKIFLI
jgi:hypothetical protein